VHIRYLNQAAQLQCVHGGMVKILPQPKRSMHVGGAPILTDFDLFAALIVGCPQIGPGLKPCTKITYVMMGLSQDIKVDGQTPILKTLQAMTDGLAPGIVRALDDGGSNAETIALGTPVVMTEDEQRRLLEAVRDAADVTGIVDPTPVSDGISGGIIASTESAACP
jgi:hypothetical protein